MHGKLIMKSVVPLRIIGDFFIPIVIVVVILVMGDVVEITAYSSRKSVDALVSAHKKIQIGMAKSDALKLIKNEVVGTGIRVFDEESLSAVTPLNLYNDGALILTVEIADAKVSAVRIRVQDDGRHPKNAPLDKIRG
jgi:hypothetical protein